MKSLFVMLSLMFSFLAATAQAKNQCSCKPIPSMKTYRGEARKKHFIGYSIDWSCTYRCKLDPRDSEVKESMVKAFYHEYHILPENGLEGICEGMVYKAQYNPMTNQDVYMYTGHDEAFSPSDSSSSDLKKWAETNYCE